MARITEADLNKIIDRDTTITDVSPFIDVANSLVTEMLTDAHPDARLAQIETWLAAHFYSILDAQRDMEKAGKVQIRNQYKVSYNLLQTRYGQAAMLLDTTGILANWNRQVTEGKRTVTISLTWAGTDEEDL